MNPLYKNLFTLAMAMFVLLAIFSLWGGSATKESTEMTFSELVVELEADNVSKLTIRGQTIEG